MQQEIGKKYTFFSGRGVKGWMDWPQKLARLTEDLNYASVARKLGFSKNRLYMIVKEASCPNAVDAVKLCRYLGVTVEEVFGKDAEVRQSGRKQRAIRRGYSSFLIGRRAYRGTHSLRYVGPSGVIDPEDVVGRKGYLPVLAPIAAGEPKEASDKAFPVGHADAYVQFKTSDRSAFALRVDGESMSPDFRHGEIVIASPGGVGSVEDVPNASLCVAIFGQERTAAFKMFLYGTTNSRSGVLQDCLLAPLNKAYPKMRVRMRDLVSVFPVVGVVKRVGS